MSEKKVLVLGAGVSGLSSAILLQRNGYSVTIWAQDVPPNTTSNKAAAVWFPYLCSPKEKAIPWAKITFEQLQEEFVDEPHAGCIYRTFTEMFNTAQPEPWWKNAFPGKIERPTAQELPDGYIDAYRIQSIVIDTSLYMEFLMQIFMENGGEVHQKTVSNIEEGFEQFSLIINCTGLGSKKLFNDDEMYPVRGQMIKIKASNFDQVVVDDTSQNTLSLVVPRVSDCMLGGTAQVGNWNTEIDSADTQEIIRKIALIAPQLKSIEILSEQVGLRPARKAIRLEAEVLGNRTFIHNYGHGGAGFTLSWGCAQDVVKLVQKYH